MSNRMFLRNFLPKFSQTTRRHVGRHRSVQVQAERLELRCLLAGLELSVLGSYFAPAGATAEIAAYDKATERVFYTSATSNGLGIVDISNPAAPAEVAIIDLSPYGGGPNSVAVKNGLVAVAVEAPNKTDPGSVLFFDASGNLLHQVQAGALPDMLTFTADGTRVLVANEGEPDNYEAGGVDPEGSITIIDVSAGVAAATATQVGFTGFNGQEAALRAAGVRIFGPGATVAQDFEPEYITTSPDGTTAYVTLQENNALAVVDLTADPPSITSILPLGYKDHNSAIDDNGLDASDRDGVINIRNWPVLGMYQPDAIASFEVGGQTYLITANEGDARDYDGFSEEVRVGSVDLDPAVFAPDLKDNANLGRLTITNTLGNTDADAEFEQLYAFGTRSFSIWNTSGQLVFDSGDDLEQITAAAYPEFFNAGNEDNDFDSRSDAKGPEPEATMVAEIGSRIYAFVGLERIGGIVVYDVTHPVAPTFIQYINNRDFTQPIEDQDNDLAKDLGLEDLKFIAADESPTGTPLVLSVNEISGTVTMFAVNLPSGAEVIDGVLEIIGTPGSDKVQITQQGGSLRVDANFLSPRTATFDLTGIESIHVILGAGNDHAAIDDSVTLPSTIEGWSGNDRLVAGGGPSTVLGGTGNDQLAAQIGAAILGGGTGNDRLSGGQSRDILIGGEGNDSLFGNDDEDILIGGRTNYDVNLSALAALLDVWNGGGSFDARRLALETGVASADGTLQLVDGLTVHDDGNSDQLFGGSDDNWLFE